MSSNLTVTLMAVGDAGESVPEGGDPTATSWDVVNDRWVKNIYANGDVTMSDKVNEQMWPYFATPSRSDWGSAISFCDNWEYGGCTDWRLPSKAELIGQYSEKGYFTGVQYDYFWSSTEDDTDRNKVWLHFMGVVSAGGYYPKTWNYWVWPVRDGLPVLVAGSATVSSAVDTRDFILSVDSMYGSPTPAVGGHSNYCWNSSVNCIVEKKVVVAGTNRFCVGWSGSGSISGTGHSNQFRFVLDEPVSSLVWEWENDSDNDEIRDSVETEVYGTDPFSSDSDLDGLMDNFEIFTFGSNPLDANSDDDTHTDQQEYIALTDPNDPSDCFKVDSCGASNGNFYLEWQTATGRTYTVQSAPDLSGPWTNYSALSGTGLEYIFTNTPSAATQQFYKVGVSLSDAP